MNNNKKPSVPTTPAASAELQLRRLALFSSGVGFYEYGGEIDGSKELTLAFNADTINDALKSIVINDPEAGPVVSYLSEQTLDRTLKGLSVDLHNSRGIAAFFEQQKGAEIEVFLPSPIKGRIMLVEYRLASNAQKGVTGIDEKEAYLALFTTEGIRIVEVRDIKSFLFTDPVINADLIRALDIIAQSRDTDIKELTVKLPGSKKRGVSLSYVIPAPVWKVSYRLDLSQDEPFLQGWAIIDNDSDTYWVNTELSLVTGRPVSFIQELYPPYYVERETYPLDIAGTAEPRVYEESVSDVPSSAISRSTYYCQYDDFSTTDENITDEVPRFLMNKGGLETANGRAAGEQFQYTIKTPVSLPRHQSAMLPLVEGAVSARKTLIYTASSDNANIATNPATGAELTNNTGMKLPAGAITVYDGGTYAGDALIRFFPEDDKRFISYGEDLSVTGHFFNYAQHTVISASASKGVLTIKRRDSYKKVYTFRNASKDEKRLIIEQPINSRDAELIEPASCMEKTSGMYRFELSLPPGETVFEVMEEEPIIHTWTLDSTGYSTLLSFISNKELPEKIRNGLKQAEILHQAITAADEQYNELKDKLKNLYDEQSRIRKNISAAGTQTQQGQRYLDRLTAQENDIAAVTAAISAAEAAKKNARQKYDAYLQELDL